MCLKRRVGFFLLDLDDGDEVPDVALLLVGDGFVLKQCAVDSILLVDAVKVSDSKGGGCDEDDDDVSKEDADGELDEDGSRDVRVADPGEGARGDEDVAIRRKVKPTWSVEASLGGHGPCCSKNTSQSKTHKRSTEEREEDHVVLVRHGVQGGRCQRHDCDCEGCECSQFVSGGVRLSSADGSAASERKRAQRAE